MLIKTFTKQYLKILYKNIVSNCIRRKNIFKYGYAVIL